MATFYGYGNLKAPYWFIGMEEGCGPDWDKDVIPRFEHWDNRGRKIIEDVRDYHFALGIRDFWEAPAGKNVKVQRTWRRLLEIVLCAQGQEPSEENIRKFQANDFARSDSNTCLIELFPLPSPSIKVFEFSRLRNQEHNYFASRSKYRQHMLPSRILKIQELVQKHKPRHVILYGTTYRKYWSQLIGAGTWSEEDSYISSYQLGESKIWLVPHPCAAAPRNAFIKLGEKLRQTDQKRTGAQ